MLHFYFQGGVQGRVALTAYVLLAMLDVAPINKHVSSPLISEIIDVY